MAGRLALSVRGRDVPRRSKRETTMDEQGRPRRRSIGAMVLPQGGVQFRVWAPRCRRVEVVLEGGPGAERAFELGPEEHGYHSGSISSAGPGTLYRYRLDGG